MSSHVFSVNLIHIRSIISVCGLFFLCLSYQPSVKENKQSNSGSKQKIQTVGVVSPESRNFTSEIKIIGSAKPHQQVKLHALENGYIRSINNDIGDKVQKGTTLASISNPTLVNQYHESQARVKQLAAEVEIKKAQTARWQAEVNSSKKIYDRIHNIYEKTPNIVLAADHDNAMSIFENAKAQLISNAASIRSAEASHQAATAQEKGLADRVGMLRMRAPFTGVITKRNMDQGAVVQSAMTSTNSMPLFEIQDIDRIRLTIQVPESDAGLINQGDSVRINFPELPGGTFFAIISRTANVLDQMSKAMQAEIDIDNGDYAIKPGMYAEVVLKAKNRKSVLSLPTAARMLIQDIPHILIVKDNIIQKVILKEGLNGRDYFEILNADIDKNTQVVVQGKSLVREGQQVQATPLNN